MPGGSLNDSRLRCRNCHWPLACENVSCCGPINSGNPPACLEMILFEPNATCCEASSGQRPIQVVLKLVPRASKNECRIRIGIAKSRSVEQSCSKTGRQIGVLPGDPNLTHFAPPYRQTSLLWLVFCQRYLSESLRGSSALLTHLHSTTCWIEDEAIAKLAVVQ